MVFEMWSWLFLVWFCLVRIFLFFANQSVVEEVVICKEGVCKNNYYLQLTMFDKNKVKTPSKNRKTQFSY